MKAALFVGPLVGACLRILWRIFNLFAVTGPHGAAGFADRRVAALLRARLRCYSGFWFYLGICSSQRTAVA
jgi:hypothetical protein